MNDFLDHYEPGTYTRSTIRCDTGGCDAQIVVERDISEAESYLIARENGWSARMGARAYHHCPKCKEQQR
jgi:hypothetical protein